MEIDKEYLDFAEALSTKRHKELIGSLQKILLSQKDVQPEIDIAALKKYIENVVSKHSIENSAGYAKKLDSILSSVCAEIDKLKVNENSISAKLDKIINTKANEKWDFQIKRNHAGYINGITATLIK
jgi:hypothetical protein